MTHNTDLSIPRFAPDPIKAQLMVNRGQLSTIVALLGQAILAQNNALKAFADRDDAAAAAATQAAHEAMMILGGQFSELFGMPAANSDELGS